MDGKAWLDRAGETSREIRLASRYDAVSLGKGSLGDEEIRPVISGKQSQVKWLSHTRRVLLKEKLTR